MEVVETVRAIDEVVTKASSDVMTAPTDLNTGTSEPSLTNGHDHKIASLEHETISSSLTATANLNGHNENEDTGPHLLNGLEASVTKETQSTTDAGSSFPASGATADTESLLPTSSQSVPDLMDESAMKLDLPPLDAAPVVVQQPTSEIRTEAEPTSLARTAEIKEQKMHEDMPQTPALANVSITNASDPVEIVVESEATDLAEASVPAQASESVPTSEPILEPQAPSDPMDTTADSGADAALATKSPTAIATEQVPNHPDVPVPEGTVMEAPVDPAPSPVAPTKISAAGPAATDNDDQIMHDVAPVSSKNAREREDDDLEDRPSAKRAKTEDETAPTAEFKVPERPANETEVGETQAEVQQNASSQMTRLQQKHLLKTLGNVKRISAAKWFTSPVDWQELKIPSYPNIIKNPMDLRTLEENLRADKYSTVEAAVAAFNLIPENARTFNGPEHGVTVQANIMKASFDKSMEKLPGPEATEVNASDRKKKAPSPGTVKIPPRRESRSSLPGPARSPVSAASPQTFALGPEGMPLIRRDSTIDGRPKREIHKPAPRDLPYANSKPKKKKYQWELKFCEKVLNELSKPKYQALSYPFMVPVDPVALNIPTYFQVVKKPMDFGTIRDYLSQGRYENAKEFEVDARQVFKNCYLFNPPGDVIHQTGRDFEKIFDSEWAQKKQWVENNTPASGPQSPGSSEAEDSEEEDDEEEEDEEEQGNELLKLQQQIVALSKQVELVQKKKKSPPMTSKKATKSTKPAKKEKKTAAAAPAKADKKAAKVKKEKIPYVTYEQKQDISERINMLPDQKMATALGIIRSGMPTLEGVEQDEIELDIDELNNEVLYKLLQFVRKNAPRADDSPAPPRPKATSSSAAPPRKKNKPMSKHEQEARIAQVQSRLSAYQQGNPIPYSQAEAGGDADDDDADSDEDESSEEE